MYKQCCKNVVKNIVKSIVKNVIYVKYKMGGGILPVAYKNNKLYFLFSRETIDGTDDPGKWSDFGGGKEKNETPLQTAIREGWEESAGFLGEKKDIKNLIKHNKIARLNFNGYATYIVEIQYDNKLPNEFQKYYKKIKKTHPELIHQHNGLFEKDKLTWMPYHKLKSNLHRFRPWYRGMVKLIIKKFE